MNINSTMGDKEIMFDSLSSQKFVTSNYNTYANECVNPQLKKDMLNILQDEHQIQTDIYNEVSTRGWYQTKQAPQNEVTMAKQKFTSTS